MFYKKQRNTKNQGYAKNIQHKKNIYIYIYIYITYNGLTKKIISQFSHLHLYKEVFIPKKKKKQNKDQKTNITFKKARFSYLTTLLYSCLKYIMPTSKR